MFEEHPVFQAPDDPSIHIWRYIDLAKYISLLDDKALYFCRMDKLVDQFEGSLPRPNLLARSDHPDFNRMVQSADGRVETYGEAISRYFRLERTHAFVNCWHMNDHESTAMWQLYCSNTQGIAIRSTYQALCESFRNYSRPVYVGVVNYIDYDQQIIRDTGSHDPVIFNMLSPLVHKRRSYQHEAEVRAIVTWEPPLDDLPRSAWQEPEETGILVPVELDLLIESVVVAPDAPQWFFEVARSVSTKYGLSVSPNHSGLGEAPLF